MRDSVRFILNQMKDKVVGLKSLINSTEDKKEIKAYINNNFKNKWVNLLLKLATHYITRTKSLISLGIIYLAFIIPSINGWSFLQFLAAIFIPEDYQSKQKIVDSIGMLSQALDIIIVVIVSIVILIIIVFYIVLKYWEKKELIKSETERTRQLEFFGFTPNEEWFISNNDIMIAQLGQRYSPQINFSIPKLLPVYQSLVDENEWKDDFRYHLQNIIVEIRKLYNKKNDAVKGEFNTIENRIDNIIFQYNSNDSDIKSILTLLKQIIEGIEKCINNCRIKNLISEDFDYQVKNIYDLYQNLDIFSMQIHLNDVPLCHIVGEAGMGKSHLIADIIKERQKRGKYSVLLIGANFIRSDKTPQQQIEDLLGLKCSFNDWLRALNDFATSQSRRIYIFLDGINEGQGGHLWSNVIKGFESEIMKYQWLGLVISARTFNSSNILLDDGLDVAYTLNHPGFNGAIEQAVDHFISIYKLNPDIGNIITGDIANPLFLKIYCEAYDKSQSINSLLDIINNYIALANKRITDKLSMPKIQNYVQIAIRVFAKMCIMDDGSFKSYHKFDEYIIELSTALPSSIDKHRFIQELVDEGLLLSFFDTQSSTAILHFNYELVGGYLIADTLLNNGNYDLEEIYYSNIVREPFAILFPLHTGKELFTLKSDKLSSYDLNEWFIESLPSKLVLSSNAIDYIKKVASNNAKEIFSLLPHIVFHNIHEAFVNFNIWMLSLSIVDRDSLWTITISNERKNGAYYRLAERFFNMSDERIMALTDYQNYQITSVLIWMLSLTYRPARDLATKGLVKFFRHHILYIKEVLNVFDKVNDPYIRQRIYASILGAVLLSRDSDEKEQIAIDVYLRIFDNGKEVPADILLRDYARNIIEYIFQTHKLENVKLDIITPPYKSYFSLEACPISKDILAKYQPLKKDGRYSDIERAKYFILWSMRTERSSMGMYGDFGRYTFGSAVRYWDINDELASNYAISLIFEKYCYDARKFAQFDVRIGTGRGREHNIERIGKKYQWIAFYETLALIADNIAPIQDSYWGHFTYYGTWNPYIRDIDPTSDFLNKDSDYEKQKNSPRLNWIPKDHISFKIEERDNWLTSNEGMEFENFFKRIQISDNNGEIWIALYTSKTHYETYETLEKSIESRCEFWIYAQAYNVSNEYANKVKDYITKHGGYGRNLPESRNPQYELFYKDYYKTIAYKEFTANKMQDYNDIFGRFFSEELVFDINNPAIEFAYMQVSPNENRSCYRLSNTIFTNLNLHDGTQEGEYVDSDGNLIAMDISVNYNHSSLLLIKKSSLKDYLLANNRQIIWPILAEKSIAHTIGDQFGGFISWDGKTWNGLLQHYDSHGRIIFTKKY